MNLTSIEVTAHWRYVLEFHPEVEHPELFVTPNLEKARLMPEIFFVVVFVVVF